MNRTFKEVFDELFPFAVEAGIDAREYWLYTISEINMTIEGYHKRLTTKAHMDYKLADLIGISAGRIVSKDIKYPTIEQAYPGLIAGRSQEDEVNMKALRTKSWLMQYALANNARRGEE